MRRKYELSPSRFLTIFFLLLSLSAWAQLDKLHYIPPFFAPDSVGNVYRDVGQQWIVLSTQEESPFEVIIYRGNAVFGSYTISKSSPELILLGSGFDSPSNPTGVVNEDGMNRVLTDQGFMLEGDYPFFTAIYQRSGAQGDVLTCKGETALGNEFYSGHIHGYLSNLSRKSNFLTVMATFDNTQVTFSNPRVRWQGQGANTFTVTLNKNESYALGASYSYIAQSGYEVNDYNGTKVSSTKPIVVNSGSWCGSANKNKAQDIGIDQLVPQSFVGEDYVLVEGYGTANGEKVTVIATRPNTNLYVNDTLEHTFAQAGEYYTIDQEEYSDDSNLALRSSKKVYVFQTLSGRRSDVAVGLCFIPPLSCLSNREVNVSFANEIGDPMLNLITEKGSTISINGKSLSQAPKEVHGNPDWVTYRLDSAALVAYDYPPESFEIISTNALNAALAFQDGAIGGAGFYSGFGVSPQLLATPNVAGTSVCFPNNAQLSADGYDSYIWYYNNEIIPDETGATLLPNKTGQYRVSGLTNCGMTKASEPFILNTCLSIEGGGTLYEGGAEKAIYVHLGLAAEEDVEYWYRTLPVTAEEGQDYKALTGVGIIEAGQTSDSLFLKVIDDEVYEGGSESLQFEVYYASHATVQNSTIDFQIEDNDVKPNASVSNFELVQENEAYCTIVVDFDKPSEVSASVDYRTYDLEDPSGADRYYTPVSGTLTIAAGEKQGRIKIPIIDNDDLNPSRDFFLKLENPQHIQLNIDEVKVTIQDDDSPNACLKLFVTATEYLESDGDFQVQIKLDEAQEVKVSCLFNIDFVSASVADFSLLPDDGVLEFLPGDTLKILHFSILDDALVESAEVFKLSLSDGLNANICSGSTSITLKNNDYIPQLIDDNFSCLEDKYLRANVLDNDVILGDTPVYVDYTQPDFGLFIGDTLGQFFYQAPENFSGLLRFNYGVRDMSGDSVSAQVQIVVQQVNDVPIAYNDTVQTDEDVPFDIFPLLNDNDVDKTGLSIESVDDNELGDVDLFTQYLHYSPHLNANGTELLSYAIQDREGDPAYAKILVRIKPINDVPIANNDVFRMNEDDDTRILDILQNDIDQDRSGLSIKSISNIIGGTAKLHDQRVLFTPFSNFWGEASFEYVMQDGEGDSAKASVTIEILGANDWPQAVDDTLMVNEDQVLRLPLMANDVDDDQRGLQLVRIDSALHGRIFTQNDEWYYQADANYNGRDSFRYFIEDWNNDGDYALVNITINAINEAPLAQADSFSILEDESLQFSPLDNDEDPDASGLIFMENINLHHGNLQVKNGVFTYVPESNYYGDNSFQYVIADGEGDRDTAWVVLTILPVNEKPIAKDDHILIDEDTQVEIPLLANDLDVDKTGLRLDTIISSSAAELLWSNDTLLYKPAANVCGGDTLSYTISDAQNDKAVAHIYITINCINEAPIAQADTLVFTEDIKSIFHPLANDEDPDNGGITLFNYTDPPHGKVDLEGGKLYYTSDENYAGADSMTYVIIDAEGDKDTALVMITVLQDNDYPVAVADFYTMPEDALLVMTPLDNDSDQEDEELTRFKIFQEPNLGEYKISAQTISYQAKANLWGYDTMSYVALDSVGAMSELTYIYIQIDSVNESPISQELLVEMNEDGGDTIDVLSFALDPDFSGVHLSKVEGASRGDAFIYNQKIIYHSNLNFYGKDTLRYTIEDGEGDKSTSSIFYTILPVNDAPVAIDDSLRTLEDVALEIFPLLNDMDVEDVVLSRLEVLKYPNNGVLEQTGSKLVYTPDENWWGRDTLRYLAKDTEGASSESAHVYIEVDSVNEVPIVEALMVNVNEDTRDTIDLLSYAQSPDFSPLVLDYPELPTFSADVLTEHGTYFIQDNTLIYQADLNYYGPDSLIYYVHDGEGDISSATLSIQVLSVNDAPVAYPDTFHFVQGIGEEDKFTLLPLTINDTDVDEDPVQGRLLVDSLPKHGLVAFSQDDLSLIYYPDSAFTGFDSIAYRIQDTLLASSNQVWVMVHTDSFNFVPRAVNDSITLSEDASISFNPLANDWDVHNDSLWPTVEQLLPINGPFPVSASAYGFVYLERDTLWTYQPELNFYGRDSFFYFANDPKGGITRAKVCIDVMPVNDAPHLSMKYEHLYYAENSGWRPVLIETAISDVDNTLLRKAKFVIEGETMALCQLKLTQNDLLDRVEYQSNQMQLLFKDTLMSISDWEHALDNIRYRNDSENDTITRYLKLVVWDADDLVSDTLTWELRSFPENDPPQLIAPGDIQGSYLPDSILSCSSGQWFDPDGEISYLYQWWANFESGNQLIAEGADSILLIKREMQNARYLWCEVTAYNATDPPLYASPFKTDSFVPENYYPDSLILLGDTLFRTAKAGTFIGLLQGHDPDSLQTLYYELRSARDSFYIIEDSLFLAISAYELTSAQVDVQVRVVDNGPQSLAQDFELQLFPYNDLMPFILPPYPYVSDIGGDEATLHLSADKAGLVYYAVFEMNADLDNSWILPRAEMTSFDAHQELILPWGDLASETSYFFAIQLYDTSQQYSSGPYFAPFTTLDITGPQYLNIEFLEVGIDHFNLDLELSEPGDLYYRLRENDSLYTLDSMYIDSLFLDSAWLSFPPAKLANQINGEDLKSQMRYDLYLSAQDTLGNTSDTLVSFSTRDTVCPHWRFDYPLLLDVSESRIRYQLQSTEQGRVILRLGTNYDEVDSFLSVYDADLYQGEEIVAENEVHSLRTDEIELDGIYHLDLILLDTAGNRSQVRSINFRYPEPFEVELKNNILAYGDDVVLKKLTEVADYYLYNISGELLQEGIVKTDDFVIEIPTLHEGIYIIRFSNEFGDYSFRLVQLGK